MPLYTFYSEKKKEYRDIFFHMEEEKKYCGENGDEMDEWKRIYHIPNASIDTKADPFNANSFVEKTKDKKGTYGDLLDHSKELSEKRAELRDGKDPVKEKYFEEYSKKRRGAKHLDQMKSYESDRVKVDFKDKE